MRSLHPERDLYAALREFERGPSRPAPVAMSPALVGASETIGTNDCWCGREQNHDWPLKDQGVAHPRYSS